MFLINKWSPQIKSLEINSIVGANSAVLVLIKK